MHEHETARYNAFSNFPESKLHKMLRLPRKVEAELHQMLRLPRKVNTCGIKART